MADNDRDIMLTLMLSEKERSLLKAISTEEGIKTMAGMVRHMIYTEARRYGLIPERPALPEPDPNFSGELVID